MKFDLAKSLEGIIYPKGNWDGVFDFPEFEIIPCDDIDKFYILRAKEGKMNWLNRLENTNLRVMEINSPEKGTIDIKIWKICPEYFNTICDYSESFLNRVAEYFTDTLQLKQLIGKCFKMTEHHSFDTVDTSYMAHNNEGDEIGWVEQEGRAYLGAVFTLEAPELTEEEEAMVLTEEAKGFIVRKLKAMFKEVRGSCTKMDAKEDKETGKIIPEHWEFSVRTF